MYIAVSGTCYWCMEAVLRSLKGISRVEQGFVKTNVGPDCEAVLCFVDLSSITLKDVVSAHLATHACTANHSSRQKYPSAIYPVSANDTKLVTAALEAGAKAFDLPVVTEVRPFAAFYPTKRAQQNYFWRQTEKPFCQGTILPKLQALALSHPHLLTTNAMAFLQGTLTRK
ncbi:peptide-methionine (S)-S-oxide reductase [Enterovibrio nigricans]|uniref:peptide-methionine (S)-S-oxide reductase n=1 Tax=Enterovibrio nigricans DSM 22720 TaxID=1121868 RepID=A0A1T4UM66_9GAMM|nr:peptide-methionine (S)-S-oxide reductase [Enterovibrio nigricans]PKF49494.1 peptide methionine sulfoxide reductase [Enterovibrio nigricans]SKA53789.1 peptide-methionine (S)-S-oxide reductase [Enterovibrio nigricans DSM 22720]